MSSFFNKKAVSLLFLLNISIVLFSFYSFSKVPFNHKSLNVHAFFIIKHEVLGFNDFSSRKVIHETIAKDVFQTLITKETTDDCSCPDTSDSSTIATTSDGGEDPGDPSPVDPGYKIKQLLIKYNY